MTPKIVGMSSQVERRKQLGLPSENPTSLNPSKSIVQDKMVWLAENLTSMGYLSFPKYKLTLICFYPLKIVDLFACYDGRKD